MDVTVGLKCEVCGFEVPWSDHAAAELMAAHIKEAHPGQPLAPREEHHGAAQDKLDGAGK